METETATPWAAGRLGKLSGPPQILFGRVYEDCEIEAAAFAPSGRYFCIASAGDTAFRLSELGEVTAVDINPVQLEYAKSRAAGGASIVGQAERVMAWARSLQPLAGWNSTLLREFLSLDDTARQLAFWKAKLDTRRFRWGFDAVLGAFALRAVYALPFLQVLPPRFGAVMRARFERGFSLHANKQNPYARALLLGEWTGAAVPATASDIRFVCADAAEFLESCAPGSFDGLSISNVLDGTSPAYSRRLKDAVKRAASPKATAVMRSFGEPTSANDRAADDRSLLWGSVVVMPAREL